MINSYNTSAVYINGLCFLRALCEGCVPQRPTSHSVLFCAMKDIPWYEGRYAVTEDGRVWSYPKAKWHHKWKFLSLIYNKWYLTATLRSEYDRKKCSVHRLVALAYIPNPDNKPFINHKNGIRDDNRIENIEWCTPSENNLHYIHVLWHKNSYEHMQKMTNLAKQYFKLKRLNKF